MQLVTILGSTCSGKSQMAVDYAKKLQTQGIVSWILGCDSRQIYKEFNLASAKVPGAWKNLAESQTKAFFYEEVPHFLIDFVDLAYRYSLADYVIDFVELVRQAKLQHNPPKVLILCGGTGLYARAINQNYALDIIKPQFKAQFDQLKTKLQSQNFDAILTTIQNNYNSEYQRMNLSDKQNLPRLVNLVLRCETKTQNWSQPLEYPAFESKNVFGIITETKSLEARIKSRIIERVSEGMLEELKFLIEKYGVERISELGLEGRVGVDYFQNNWSVEQFQEILFQKTIEYVKRQNTWLKKEPEITWISNLEEITAKVPIF